MLKVTIDVSPTVQKHAGLGRYAGEIARVLSHHEKQVDLRLFYNRYGSAELPDYLKHLPHKSVHLGNKPWRMSVLLSQLLRVPLDHLFGTSEIFHATNHLLARFGRARTVFTLHDLIFLRYPEYHLPYNRWFLRFAMPRFLKAADAIITPSECSKQDAIHFYQIAPEKIRVIPEAPASHFTLLTEPEELAEVQQRLQLPKAYVLHVGTIEPRKNLTRLLHAFKPLLKTWPNLKIVFIGKQGWLYNDFFAEVERLELQDVAIFPGYIPEKDLPAVYQLARLLAYPSLYEGFGLPPLEAMACGTPLISSNSASLPEVVGEGGMLLDPLDTEAWTETMHQFLSDETVRAKWRQHGLMQARQFSWHKTAMALLEVYQTVLNTV